jgi:hypothetical protein
MFRKERRGHLESPNSTGMPHNTGVPSVICCGISANRAYGELHHVHDGHIIASRSAHVEARGVALGSRRRGNTITTNYCDTNVAYGSAESNSQHFAHYGSFHQSQVEARIAGLPLLVDTYVWHPKVSVGYIDLTSRRRSFTKFPIIRISMIRSYVVSYALHGG